MKLNRGYNILTQVMCDYVTVFMRVQKVIIEV
jgi:hypothetical protein